jgi:hypothetical protein
LGHRTNVNKANTPIFKIFVEGGDVFATPPNWSSGEPGVDYRGDGTFFACYVYSPNATQWWRGKPAAQDGYTTQVFAKNVVQNSGLNVKFDHPQNPDCFAPEFTCSSIGRVTPGMSCNSANGAVNVLSWGAYEDSLSYLLFINAATGSIPIYPSVDALRAQACMEFTSAELTYTPPYDPTTGVGIENSITTPNIWVDGNVLANCGDGTNLVPVLVGPVDPENGPGFPPVCYNVYTYERLNVASPDTCTVIRP